MQVATEDEVPISMTVVKQAMTESQAILSADVMGDGRFRSSESLTDLKLRSLMCIRCWPRTAGRWVSSN